MRTAGRFRHQQLAPAPQAGASRRSWARERYSVAHRRGTPSTASSRRSNCQRRRERGWSRRNSIRGSADRRRRHGRVAGRAAGSAASSTMISSRPAHAASVSRNVLPFGCSSCASGPSAWRASSAAGGVGGCRIDRGRQRQAERAGFAAEIGHETRPVASPRPAPPASSGGARHARPERAEMPGAAAIVAARQDGVEVRRRQFLRARGEAALAAWRRHLRGVVVGEQLPRRMAQQRKPIVPGQRRLRRIVLAFDAEAGADQAEHRRARRPVPAGAPLAHRDGAKGRQRGDQGEGQDARHGAQPRPKRDDVGQGAARADLHRLPRSAAQDRRRRPESARNLRSALIEACHQVVALHRPGESAGQRARLLVARFGQHVMGAAMRGEAVLLAARRNRRRRLASAHPARSPPAPHRRRGSSPAASGRRRDKGRTRRSRTPPRRGSRRRHPPPASSGHRRRCSSRPPR